MKEKSIKAISKLYCFSDKYSIIEALHVQSINYFIVRLKVDQLPTQSAALMNN